MPQKDPSFISSRPITRSLSAKRRLPQATTPRYNRAKTVSSAARKSPAKAINPLVSDLQSRLDAVADQKYRVWIEAYLRHVIPCRGIRAPGIQAVVKEWSAANDLYADVPFLETDLARALFESEYSEDKFAGAVYVHDVLQPRGLIGTDRLPFFAALFDDGLLSNWSTVDSFCMRVLGRMVKQHGDRAIEQISEWRYADNVWRARASVVGLLGLSKKKEYYPRIWENCAVLIKRDERFAKTAVGWMLREVQRADEDFVLRFVDDHARWMSLEAVKNATKHCSDRNKKKYVALVKTESKKASSS